MIHILKLCVGAKSPDLLEAWQSERPDPVHHVTRMWPRRADDIIGKGSIYWVMDGEIRARQKIIDLVEVTGEDGIRRCKMCFERGLTLVVPTARRPFQGWRYLQPQDAPPDIGKIGHSDLPPEIAGELSKLGLT